MHNKIKNQLTEYFDGELGQREAQEVKAHIAICEDCRQGLARMGCMRAVLSRTGKTFSGMTGPAFVQNVMNRIEEIEAPQPVPTSVTMPDFARWLIPAFGYTCAVFVMFVAISSRQPEVSAEAVLLESVPPSAQWAISNEPPDAGELLNF